MVYGVSYNKKMDKWYGEIQCDYMRYRKAFDTEEEALAYRLKLEKFKNGELEEKDIL